MFYHIQHIDPTRFDREREQRQDQPGCYTQRERDKQIS